MSAQAMQFELVQQDAATLAWLQAEGIDPNLIPVGLASILPVEGGYMFLHAEYLLDERGQRIFCSGFPFTPAEGTHFAKRLRNVLVKTLPPCLAATPA